MKEENTQVENRRTHTADRNLQTDTQTEKKQRWQIIRKRLAIVS